MAAVELVDFVARSLVDDPDAVSVEVREEDGAQLIELHVAEDDMGKVIGRNGSVAKALRTLLKVVSAREGAPSRWRSSSRSEPAGAARPARCRRDPPDRERLTVGLVRGLHGLRGAVRVEVLSDDPDRFEVGSVLHLDGEDDAAHRRLGPGRRPRHPRPLPRAADPRVGRGPARTLPRGARRPRRSPDDHVLLARARGHPGRDDERRGARSRGGRLPRRRRRGARRPRRAARRGARPGRRHDHP